MNKEIKNAFEYLDENQSKMTFGQIRFIASLKKHYRIKKELTNPQALILFEIKNSVERRE